MLSRVVRARYEGGVLKPLEPLELKEGEEVLVKVVEVERRRKALRRHRGALGPVPKELLDRSGWRRRSSNTFSRTPTPYPNYYFQHPILEPTLDGGSLSYLI